MEADTGIVKIDIKVLNQEALKAAKETAKAFGNIKVNKNMNKDLDSLAASTKKTTSAASSLGKEVRNNSNDYNRLQERLKTTSKYFNDLSQAQAKSGNQYQAQLSKQASLRASLTRVNNALEQQKKAIVDNTKQFGVNSEQTEKARNKYQALQGEQAKLTTDFNLLNKSIGNMTPQMAAAADKANLFAKRMSKAGDTMIDIGGKATTRMTLPIVAGMGVATKAASDYQYQLADIRKEVVAQGYSANQVNAIMKRLSSETLKWSKEFGVGTKEINEGMFELVSNGYNVKQAMGMMPELLKTMTANSDKTGLSIKLTSSMLEQFGMNLGSNNTVIRNGNKIMNQMTEATHKSAMSLGDLKEISGNAGAAMHAMGISTNDFLAIAGRLKSAGIDASSVGTGLSSMITRIGTGTGLAAKDLQKYNIQMYDSNGKMRNILDVLGDMQKAYQGMTDKERQKFMYDVIGQENMKVGMTLMDANLGRYRSLSNEIQHSTGTVDKYNQTMRKTNDFTEQQFKSSLHALEIEFGQKLLPTLTPIIKQLTNMVNSFSKLNGQTQQNIIHMGLLAAAIGPVTSALGHVTKGVGNLGKGAELAIKFLGRGSGLAGTAAVASKAMISGGTAATGLGTSIAAMAGPAAVAVAGIGVLGTAIYLAAKASKEHSEKIKQHEKILNEFGVAVDYRTQKSMRSFNKLRQSATNDLAQLDNATVSQSKKLSDDAVDKYSKMADLIIQQYQRTNKKGQETVNAIGVQFGEIGNKWASNIDISIKSSIDSSTKKLNEARRTIHDILVVTGGDLSKMTDEQKESFTQATNYIQSQTSAFGIAVKDQEALYSAYVKNRNKITQEYLNKDLTATDKARNKALSAAKANYNKQSKQLESMLQHNQITQKQYNQAEAALDAEKQRNRSKANIEWIKTTKAAYEHYKNDGTEYLKTKKNINDVAVKYDITGQKQYQSVLTGAYVSRKKWIEEVKSQNNKYISDQEKSHGTIEKNLDKFEKSQKEVYEKMGLNSKQAKAQAELDRQELAAETTKTASQIEKDTKAIHESFIKGLKDGSINGSEVAKKWGLDLSDSVKKINLGKYGKKTAAEFWQDFNSGSKLGFQEAKVYFKSQINDFKDQGLTSFKKLGSDNVAALRSGLQAGVISLSDLKPLLGKKVLDLFPKDLNQVSNGEIASLKSGYENGLVSLKQLKNHFGDSIYKLFPDDLSNLGKKEISTLNTGLKDGKINASDLRAKYQKQLQEIYSQDLSDLGKNDIQSLQNALKSGIINETELKNNFRATLDRIYSQTPKLNQISKGNLATLQQAMSLGITNPQEIANHYQKQLESIYKKDLSHLGKSDIETLATGIKLGLPGTGKAMQQIQNQINKNAKVNLGPIGKGNIDDLVRGFEQGKIGVKGFMKALKKLIDQSTKLNEFPNGNNTIQSYANGMTDNKGAAVNAAGDVRDKSESNLTPTDQPNQHGNDFSKQFGQGIQDLIDNPFTAAGNVKDKAESNLTPTDKPHKHGANHSILFGQGIFDTGGSPLGISANIEDGVNGNFNGGIDSANNISNQLGSKKKYSSHKAKSRTKVTFDPLHLFKNGTQGFLQKATTAIVGDGYEPELISYGNDEYAISPPNPTLVHLPKFSQVFSGAETKKIQKTTAAFGVPMFANGTGGSWLNTAWDWIKKAVGDIEEWVEHPIQSWEKLINTNFDMTNFGNNSEMGTATESVEKQQTNWLKKLIEETANPPGSGVQRWRPMVERALAMLGLSTSEAMINKVLSQIQTESGGNPSVIGGNDGLPDGNATGLMQVKPPTFNAYALPGHHNIMNGFDNILAGLNYAKATYGPSLYFLGHGHGYDNGGWIDRFGLYPISENNPEVVINPKKSSAVPLINEALSEVQKYQPNAMAKIVLPAQGITPEMASGYRPLPAKNYNSVSNNMNLNNSNNIDQSLESIDKLTDTLKQLGQTLRGNCEVNIQVDGMTISTAIFPKIQMMLNKSINIQTDRRGQHKK